jgi:hypothetical protein
VIQQCNRRWRGGREAGKVASSRVAQHIETYRSKRLPAGGCTSKNNVRVIILENAEKSLECGLVTETTGQLETAIMSVCASMRHRAHAVLD